MATYYLDSSASGANDGSSWADAFTSIDSTLSLAAGSIVLAHYQHLEQFTTYKSWTWANGTSLSPVVLVSVDKVDNSRRAGATVEVTNNNLHQLNAGVRICGFTFGCYWTIKVNLNGLKVLQFEDCVFRCAGSGSGTWAVFFNNADTSPSSRFRVSFRNCTFDGTLVTGGVRTIKYDIVSNRSVDVLFEGCNWVAQQGNAVFFGGNGNFPYAGSGLTCIGCDLSEFSNLVQVSSGTGHPCYFSGCKLKSGWSPTSGTKSATGREILVENCGVGTLSVPSPGLNSYDTYYGQVTRAASTIYRSGGSNDGYQTDPYAWTLVTNANAGHFVPLYTPWLWIHVPSGSVSVTAYIAGSSSLTDQDAWLEIAGPDSAVSPTAQDDVFRTASNWEDSPATLASDSSTWAGSGVGTVQKITQSYTSTIAGFVRARLALGKASTTLQFDPKLDVSGVANDYQRMSGGPQVLSATSGGGGGGLLVGGGMTGGFHRT